MSKYVKRKTTLQAFYQKKDTILIYHEKGGLGDIVMQRMLFFDIKKIHPNCKLIFACMPEYKDAVADHPYIDEVVDCTTVNLSEYPLFYDLSVTIADRYEKKHAPCVEHRSDIWATYCGLKLTNHDMHFQLNENKKNACVKQLEDNFGHEKPWVLFAPISKMATKCLQKNQIEFVKKATSNTNLIGLHSSEIKGIPGVYNVSIADWIHYIAVSDYVISVDTSTFHVAGGLNKPLVGIFSFADGKVYGKYFDFILVQKHRDNKDWDCGPCYNFMNCTKNKTSLIRPCMSEISELEITTAIQKMFDKTPWKKA